MTFSRRAPTVLLWLLAAVALLRLGFTFGFAPGEETAGRPALSDGASGGPPPVPMPEAALSSPLFSPARRAAGAAPPVADGGPLSGLRLEGVAISRGSRVANVAETATGKVHRVRAGEAFRGFVVNAIEADRVVLIRDGEQFELGFTGDKDIQQRNGGSP